MESQISNQSNIRMTESKLMEDFRQRLARSVRNGADEEFGHLLKRASSDDIESYYRIREEDTFRAVHLLGLCCHYGRYEQVRTLFEYCHRNNITINIHSGAVNNQIQHKALYKAVEGGNLNILNVLETEAKLQNKPFSSDDYAQVTDIASIIGRVDILEWLLTRTDMSDPLVKWNFRLAAVHGKIDIVNFYASKIPEQSLISMIHESLDSIFIDTASKGHLEVLNFLVQKSYDIEYSLICDKMIHAQQDLAFVRAAGQNQIPIIERLLELTKNPLKRHQMIHASEPVFGTNAAFKQSAVQGHYEMLELLITEIDDVKERKTIAMESFPYVASTGNPEILHYLIKLIHDEELQIKVLGEAFVNQVIKMDPSKIRSRLELLLNSIPSKREFLIKTHIDQAFLRASQTSEAQKECTEAQEYLLKLVSHTKRLQLATLIEGSPKRWTIRYIETLEIKEQLLNQTDSKVSTVGKFESRALMIENSKSSSIMSNLDPSTRLHDLLVTDVIILCATSQEVAEVYEVFQCNGYNPTWDESDSNYPCYRVQIDNVPEDNHTPIKIQIRIDQCPTMGSISTGIYTTYLLQKFQPLWILMSGICAGNPTNNVKLGDLVLALRVADLNAGKITDSGLEPDIVVIGDDNHVESVHWKRDR